MKIYFAAHSTSKDNKTELSSGWKEKAVYRPMTQEEYDKVQKRREDIN